MNLQVIIFVGLIVLVVAIAIYCYFLFRGWGAVRTMNDPDKKSEGIIDFLTPLGQSITAIGLIAGLALTAYSAYTASRAASGALQESQTQQQEQQYQSAVTVLATNGDTPDDVETRLSAVYSLKDLARQSRALEPNVMALLTDFVRLHDKDTPTPEYNSTLSSDLANGHPCSFGGDETLPLDIRTAVSTILQRPSWDTSTHYDLGGLDLQYLQLHGNLDNMFLYSKLQCSSDAYADSSGTRFGTSLRGASLSSADLTRATIVNGDFRSSQQSTTSLERARVVDACATRANFSGGVDLIDSDFTGANLENATFDGSKLRRANFTGADLLGADLAKSDLTNASFASANLNDVDFAGSDLSGAKLLTLNLNGADFSHAKLKGATLPTWARFQATGLSAEDLRVVKWVFPAVGSRPGNPCGDDG